MKKKYRSAKEKCKIKEKKNVKSDENFFLQPSVKAHGRKREREREKKSGVSLNAIKSN